MLQSISRFHYSLKTTFCTFLILAFTAFYSNAFAKNADTKLPGHWKGDKIELHIRADKTYTYKIKFLNFSGKWSSNNNQLKLSYKLLGVKKNKSAKYYFDKGDLILEQDGKKPVRLSKTP